MTLFIVSLLLCTFIYGYECWIKRGEFIIFALSVVNQLFLSHTWSCF